MVAVALTLLVALLTARDNAVYHDIAQYAAAQGDLAARVIADAQQAGETVVATDDTALIQRLSPRLIGRLQAVPGYILILDTARREVYRSPDVMRLRSEDMATLQTQLDSLPASGEALIFSLDSAQEKLLFVSHSLPGKPSGLSRIESGADATRADHVPAQYMFDAFLLVALIILAGGTGAFLFLGRTQRQLGEITTEV